MLKSLSQYPQYKQDIFNKLGVSFQAGKKILDLGCGDGSDAVIFRDVFGLDVYGVDIYEHENISKAGIRFQNAGIYQLPFKGAAFDYVFLHDVLHHIDEKNQDYERHAAGLRELYRVVKPGGSIIVVEGNRYNPLFYPHMVKMLGHNHWKQSYFLKTIDSVFLPENKIEYKFFEAHAYPFAVGFWKLYERLMDRLSPKQFLAYNTAIIQKIGDN